MRGKYICKEVFLRLNYYCPCSLRRYVSSIYIYIFLHESADDDATCGHLPPISKTIQGKQDMQDTVGRTHKWCFSIDPYTWTCLCWLTSKNLSTSALCRHRIEFGRSVGSDGWLGRMERERGVKEIHAVSATWWWGLICHKTQPTNPGKGTHILITFISHALNSTTTVDRQGCLWH